MQETRVQFLGQEDFLEKEMATHSSIGAWRIPQTVAFQAPLSMGFPKQVLDGLSFPSLGQRPHPGIKPRSPAVQVHSLPLSHLGSLHDTLSQF